MWVEKVESQDTASYASQYVSRKCNVKELIHSLGDRMLRPGLPDQKLIGAIEDCERLEIEFNGLIEVEKDLGVVESILTREPRLLPKIAGAREVGDRILALLKKINENLNLCMAGSKDFEKEKYDLHHEILSLGDLFLKYEDMGNESFFESWWVDVGECD